MPDSVLASRSATGTTGRVAQDLDLTETALRAWVQRAEVEALATGPPEALTGAKGDELRELRKRVKRPPPRGAEGNV
ncbi:MAG TPA: transposase, partial [Labilithrix sp.]|nr:transposase [Labilithrix sp.]